MKKKQSWRPELLTVFAGLVSVGIALPAHAQTSGRFSTVRDPNQVPTARYGRGESVDLSLIIEEWRDRYPAIPVFVCSCNATACGDASIWPSRTYTRYQPFVSLGSSNAANTEATGFNCFDMETGDRPEEI